MNNTVFSIFQSADWLVNCPLQSEAEYVSATGLQPETIVFRLSLKLGGRLAYCEDIYRTIGTSESCIDIITKGYKHIWIKSAPQQRVVARNPTISTKASNGLDTEVTGILEKGLICKVGRVQGEYVSSYFAIPKSKRSPD